MENVYLDVEVTGYVTKSLFSLNMEMGLCNVI